MRFVYAVINLLILAGLIYLVGRKSIVKIFRSRREKITRELDEAETPFAPEPLPEMPAPDDTALKSELAAAEKDGKAALAELDAQYEADTADQRREMLFTTRAQIIEQVLTLAEQHMRSAEYQASKLARQNEAVEQILAQIHLTPGDVSYISRKGVLYVTLTSAAVLPDETVEKVRKRAEALVAAAGGKISYWVRQKEELIGGLQLRIGDTIYDYTISNKLYRLGKALNDRPLTETDADSIRAGMLDAVRHMKLGIDVFQVGRVLSVSDGICWMDGLADIMYGELVEFVNGERGMVMDIQADRVGCIIFGRYDHVDSYSRVRRLNKMASVPVGEAMLGRVVDALGKPIDGRGRIWKLLRLFLLGNPLLLATLAGLALACSGLGLWQPLDHAAALIGSTAAPCMLLALGFDLRQKLVLALRRNGGHTVIRQAWLLLCKLGIHPLICWGIMHLAGLPPLWLGVGVLMSATGTALVASVLAEVYSAVPEEAALTAVLSNAASMVSLMLFIFLLQGAGCL